MPRYARQRNRYSCGPIAIINALKWAGKPASLAKYFDRFRRWCKCGYYERQIRQYVGTHRRNFDAALRRAGRNLFRVRYLAQPRLEQIDRHLEAGGAVILNYYWRDRKSVV